VLTNKTLDDVGEIQVFAGHDYDLVMTSSITNAWSNFIVDASNLGVGDALTLNAATDHIYYTVDGGAGNDVITVGPDGSLIDSGGGNDTITGGAGRDIVTLEAGNSVFNGGAGSDLCIVVGAGTDTLIGGTGADYFDFNPGFFNAADHIDGGGGNDQILIEGDYSSLIVLTGATLVSVEKIVLSGNGDFACDHTLLAAGQWLTVDNSSVYFEDTSQFNGSAETDGHFLFLGGMDTDILTGGAQNDTFYFYGNSDLPFPTVLAATDRLDGGPGNDTLIVSGAGYASGLVFQPTTIQNIEKIVLADNLYGDDSQTYNFTLDDANVAAGKTLTVDARNLNSYGGLIFNGSAETNGKFYIYGGAGTNVLTGGAGNDIFNMGANLTAADRIDGGGGTDYVYLNGDYSAGLTFGASTMVNVEYLVLSAGDSYKLTTNDATVASGQILYVNATALSSGNTFSFDGSAETDGRFSIKGGAGANILTGGAGNDTLDGNTGNDIITGGLGSDQINGGGGHDQFVYQGVADSTGSNFDAITGFDTLADSFVLPCAVNAIDATVTMGTLTLANFNTQLAAAVGAAQLAPHHAVLVEPGLGGFAGKTFLIVDVNGIAGYQAGQDFVFELRAPANLASLSTADFT